MLFFMGMVFEALQDNAMMAAGPPRQLVRGKGNVSTPMLALFLARIMTETFVSR